MKKFVILFLFLFYSTSLYAGFFGPKEYELEQTELSNIEFRGVVKGSTLYFIIYNGNKDVKMTQFTITYKDRDYTEQIIVSPQERSYQSEIRIMGGDEGDKIQGRVKSAKGIKVD